MTAQTQDVDRVSLGSHDTAYLLGLLNPMIVIAGNLMGGIWVLSGVLFMLGLGPILDHLLGCSSKADRKSSRSRDLDWILYLHSCLHFAVLGTLIYRSLVSELHWTTLGAALSTGLSSAVSGIVVAHELGHRRKGSVAWWLGRFNLLTVFYLHFTTEHNHTHHRFVATERDPATASAQESVYRFVCRTLPGQFLDAIRVHSRKGRRGFKNPILQGVGLSLMIVALLVGVGGIAVAAACCMQALFAIFLLEYINYIRHYGLLRNEHESISSVHAWQSEARWSRWTLLELSRHADHHLHASKPFWELRPYEDSPVLPSGYYGCFWIAVIPPLWRRVMKTRVPATDREVSPPDLNESVSGHEVG